MLKTINCQSNVLKPERTTRLDDTGWVFFQLKLHAQVWYLPVKMVELVMKRKMIFGVFVQGTGKEKIAQKVRFTNMK